MEEFSAFYRSGGIFMHLITLTFMWVSVLMFIQFINSITKRRKSLLPIINAGMWIILLCGILGSLFGFIDVLAIVSYAAPKDKSAMMASGISIALTTTTYSFLLLSIHLFVAGILDTIDKNIINKEVNDELV